MDKNSIGTDATIHEHISKIQERSYVVKFASGRFCPTYLGLFVHKYMDSLGDQASLTKAEFRAGLEKELTNTAHGKLDKKILLQRYLDIFQSKFMIAASNAGLLKALITEVEGQTPNLLNPAIQEGAIVPKSKKDPPPTAFEPTHTTLHNGVLPQDGELRCSCGLITTPNIVRGGKNKGKEYRTCSKAYKKCKFFEWVEDTGKRTTYRVNRTSTEPGRRKKPQQEASKKYTKSKKQRQ